MKTIYILLFLSTLSTIGIIKNVEDTKQTNLATVYNIQDIPNNIESITSVALSNQNLKELPPEVLRCKKIEKLNLRNNDIVSLPMEMKGLKELTHLNISGNTKIDMIKTIEVLKGTPLTHLDISENALLFIPYKIGNLNKLKNLNASNNYITDIPFYIKKLRKLEDVDLSHNNITTFEIGLSKWKNLQYLDVRYNDSLNYKNLGMNLSVLKNLKELKINQVESELPNEFNNVSVASLYIGQSNLKALPKGLLESENLTDLYIEDNEYDATANLIQDLGLAKNLTSLTLKNSYKEGELDFPKLINLTHLDISSNNLEHINFSKNELPNLKSLSLYQNDFSEETLLKIKSEFPNCDIQHNNMPSVSTAKNTENKNYKNFEPVIKNLEVVKKEYNITPAKSSTLAYNKTKIEIPSNAFLDKQGKVITTPISLTYREFNDPLEVAMSGIPMKYDTGGISGVFETAGMFELRAESEGKEVFPNPEALITVEMASTQKDTDYNIYKLDDETGEWIYEDKVDVEDLNGSNSLNNSPLNVSFFYPTTITRGKPEIAFNRSFPQINTKSNHKGSISFIQNYYNSGTGKVIYDQTLSFFKRRNNLYYYAPDFSRNKSKALRSFYKKHKKEYDYKLLDFEMTLNEDIDCFDITLSYTDTILTLPVNISSKHSFEKSQKNTTRFWKDYHKYTKKENKKNDKLFKKLLDAYERKLEKLQKNYRDIDLNTVATVFRKISIPNFGVWNSDRLQKFAEPITTKVELLADIDDFNMDVIYVMDLTDNGTLSYINNNISYDNKNENTFLALDSKSGKMAFCRAEDFSKLHIKNKKLKVPVTIINAADYSPSELKNIIY